MSTRRFEISVFYKSKSDALKTVSEIGAIMNKTFAENEIDRTREFSGIWRIYVPHFAMGTSYGKVMALQGVQTIRPLR